MVQLLMFGKDVSSHTLPGMWLRVHAGNKVDLCQHKRSLMLEYRAHKAARLDVRYIHQGHCAENTLHMYLFKLSFVTNGSGKSCFLTWHD